MDNETMVENDYEEVVEEVVEEQDDTTQDIEEFASESEEEQPQEEPKATEPGYVQRRIDKALAKEKGKIIAEVTAQLKTEYEAQYAPLRERLLEMDARDLLDKGVVKDIETARELVRYRNGQQVEEQPRERQITPKNDPATMARIDMLEHQAHRIAEEGGPDVIAEFKNNPDIQEKVKNGEMDFYDLAKQLNKNTRKKPPAPMRSPNGVNGVSPDSIWSMTDEQFAKMDKKLDEGMRFTLRR